MKHLYFVPNPNKFTEYTLSKVSGFFVVKCTDEAFSLSAPPIIFQKKNSFFLFRLAAPPLTSTEADINNACGIIEKTLKSFEK